MNPQHDTFSEIFDAPLPRGVRDRTAGMSLPAALASLGHSAGPLRLGHWECVDTPRAAGRMGPQPRNFKATLAIGDRICTASATGGGPVAALTAMLHDHGVALETLEFHQLHAGERTATFVRGGNGVRDEWALGLSADATDSALKALIACANRLCAQAR